MKILVIGAGVVGVSTAYYLQRYGAEVTVVERNAKPGLEASWGNGGLIHANIPPPWNEPGSLKMMMKCLISKDAPMVFRAKALPSLALWGLGFLKHSRKAAFLENSHRNTRLGMYSLKCFAELREESGVQFHHQQRGLLKVFRDQQSLDGMVQMANLLADDGAQYRLLSKEDTLQLEPALKPVGDKIVAGMHIPTDESGSPHDFCVNLAALTAEHGATYHFETAVKRLSKKSQTFTAELANGESIEADKVVLATGSHSPQLARQLGVKVPVKPAKGYSLSIPMAGWQDAPKVPLIDMGLLVGFNPIGGKFLRLGGGAEFAGHDADISENSRQNLIKQLEGVFPKFAATLNYDELEVWAGFRPVSVDGVPLIGATKVDGLYLNTGHGYLGWTMSPASGKLLAAQIMGQPTTLNPGDYAIARLYK